MLRRGIRSFEPAQRTLVETIDLAMYFPVLARTSAALWNAFANVPARKRPIVRCRLYPLSRQTLPRGSRQQEDCRTNREVSSERHGAEQAPSRALRGLAASRDY